MPHHKSAEKRLRQSKTRQLRNVARKSRLRTEIKHFQAALEGNQLEEAQEKYRLVTKLLDTCADKLVIHPNKASRTKSRLARRLNELKPTE
ncbi:30S ribosomal protein S20 [bacterium]|nr:30S ribosomal protein S20 [candidate division CSSED10-310 bacterium]